jgi:hypothetical protein
MSPVAVLVSCALASVAAAGEPDPSVDPLPPPPPPATDAAPPAASRGALERPVRVGPKISVLPLPGLIGVGLEARLKDTVTLSVEYGLLPEIHVRGVETSNDGSGTSSTISDASVSYRNLAFGAHWIPWHRAFHLGLSYGQRTVKATAKGTLTSGGLSASGVATVEATSSYLAPELGWRWIWDSGFFLGLDLGWQFVLSPSSRVEVPASAFPPDKLKDYTDRANEVASQGFPVLSLLQLGWYF